MGPHELPRFLPISEVSELYFRISALALRKRLLRHNKRVKDGENGPVVRLLHGGLVCVDDVEEYITYCSNRQGKQKQENRL